MKRLLFFLLIIPVFVEKASAQEIVTGKSFIHYLLSDSTAVDDISFSKEFKQPLAINDVPFVKEKSIVPQKFIRTKKGLFILVNGTGRVYEIKKGGSDLSVQRIDSTVFFGYNFGAFSFAYRDTIYSYGGYGIWRYNGQLRVYLPHKHEWELVPLSREIPFYTIVANGFKTWFDSDKGQLYINRMPERSMGVDSIYMLDLPSKKWSTKGKNILAIDNLEAQINTPWGILCKEKGDYTSFILLDLKKNRILRLSEQKSREIINHEQWDSKYFFRDSSLFIVIDSLYKIPLHITDFKVTEHRIYEEPKEASFLFSLQKYTASSWKLITGMLACLLIGFIGASYFQKIKNQKGFHSGSLSKKSAIPIFDEKEKGLIKGNL